MYCHSMNLKYLFVVLLVLLNFTSYLYGGYLSKASLLFNGFYFATLVVSVYVLCKLRTKPLLVFSGLAVILGILVEYVNTEAANWTYYNGGQPPLWVAVGWVFLLAIVFYSAQYLKKYVNWKTYSVIPALLCFGLFFLFSYTEGNITFLTIGLYLFMAILGVYSAVSGTFGWNFAVLVTGIVIGSTSEALGASCGLWIFRSGELLPLPMVFAWSANAFCLSGLLRVFKVFADKLFQ